METMHREPTRDGYTYGASKHRASHRLPPSVVSGIVIGGSAGAAVAGPLGAAVGMVLGVAAGKALDAAFPEDEGAGSPA